MSRKPAACEEFLALKDHRDAGRGEDEGGTEGRPLLRCPTLWLGGINFFGHTRLPVGDLIVALGVDYALKAIGVIAMPDGVGNCIQVARLVV